MTALKVIVWFLAATGGAGLFLLALPPWILWSVHKGMMLRSRVPCEIRVESGTLVIVRGDKRRNVELDRVARVRLAVNGNWTDSTIVEDAYTLFDARGRRLAKIASAAPGIDELLRTLRVRGIEIAQIEVDAPAYLD